MSARAPSARARSTKPLICSKWRRLISADTSVPSSRGSPWTSAADRSVTRAVNSSTIEDSTSIRAALRQTCPALSNCSTAMSTARSRSASAKTTSGDSPPSSNDSGTMLGAAAAAMTPAVGTDPVKHSRLMPGWAVRGAPADSPLPWTTLKTPAGTPASAMMSASRLAVRGAHSGGLRITVLPAARAGPIRQVASISGAFQGVMIDDDAGRVVGDPLPVPPAGDLHVGVAQGVLGVVGEEPEVHGHPRHHAAAVRPDQRPVVASLDAGTGPRSGPRRRRRPGAGWPTARPPARAAQAGNAARAAATARSTSSAPAAWTWAISVSSIGDTSAKVSAEATRSPPIQCRRSTATPSTTAVVACSGIRFPSLVGGGRRSPRFVRGQTYSGTCRGSRNARQRNGGLATLRPTPIVRTQTASAVIWHTPLTAFGEAARPHPATSWETCMSNTESAPTSESNARRDEHKLRHGRLGALAIAFFVVSAVAPLTGMAGGAPFAMLLGAGHGVPATYLVVTLLMLVVLGRVRRHGAPPHLDRRVLLLRRPLARRVRRRGRGLDRARRLQHDADRSLRPLGRHLLRPS